MTTKLDNAKNPTTPLPNTLASSALSNILSSVLRLYSNNSPPNSELPRSMINNDRNNRQQQQQQQQQRPSTSSSKENSSISSSSESLYPHSPRETKEDEIPTSLVDFSKTLNTATRSAQNITQDIDMLQVNIESLANNLGIDPSQFDDDAASERCFRDNNTNLMNNDSIGTSNVLKLYNDLDKDKNMNRFSYNLQQPPSSMQYQHQRHQQAQQQQQQAEQLHRPLPSQFQSYSQSSNNTRNNSMSHMQQQQPYPMHYSNNGDSKLNVNQQTSDIGYRQFISAMNYSDSFGPNYPSESETSNYTPTTPVGPPPHNLQQNRNYFTCGNDELMVAAAAAGVTTTNTENTDNYNTMMNHIPYTQQGDMNRPPYYNGMPTGENYNDNT